MNQRLKKTLLGVGLASLLLIPVAAIAAGGFDDVTDSNIFAGDIQWMKDNDITRGCNPPDNTKYCPEDNVTRQEMAAFMHRLGTKKVVESKTAEFSTDSDTVDGKHAEQLGSRTGSISAALFPFDTGVENPADVISMTGFDVPDDGGVITADANIVASIEPGGPEQWGFAWLEIDNGGTCGQQGMIPGGVGWYYIEENTVIADTVSALVTEEVAAGAHRIDLCVVGIAPDVLITIDAHMNVTWSPNTSAAGVAASDLRTWQEMIAPYKDIFNQ